MKLFFFIFLLNHSLTIQPSSDAEVQDSNWPSKPTPTLPSILQSYLVLLQLTSDWQYLVLGGDFVNQVKYFRLANMFHFSNFPGLQFEVSVPDIRVKRVDNISQ